jgi:transcription antitermination factor NusG
MRYEQAVSHALQCKGYEDYVPTYLHKRQWSDRTKVVNVPLFPGYVFCRFDLNHRLPILQTPAVIDIVRIGRTVVPVSEEEITSLRIAEKEGLQRRPCSYLHVGQYVRIEEGPLTGLQGILCQVKGDTRLVVSVTLLQRSVAVEIDSRWVKPSPDKATSARPSEFYNGVLELAGSVGTRRAAGRP